jgi:spermidine synthase
MNCLGLLSCRMVVLMALQFLLLLSIHTTVCFGTDEASSGDINEDEDVLEEPEYETGYIQTLRVQSPPIFETKSNYQRISIYESSLPNAYYGKIFVLDDCLQLTERDASHYNEMLAHVPVLEYYHPSFAPTTSEAQEEKGLRVLVLGGGDGYVVSELLKHPSVVHVDHVELDVSVIETARKFFPWATEELWNNDRVTLHIENGAAFVETRATALKDKTGDTETLSYHVIIQDSSDPFAVDPDGETLTKLPSHVLYTQEHFQHVYDLLEPNNGVLLFQAESYNVPSSLKDIHTWRKELQEVGYRSVRYGSIAIGTYPTGQIGFLIGRATRAAPFSCGQGADDNNTVEAVGTCENTSIRDSDVTETIENALNMHSIREKFDAMRGETLYYQPRIHRR